MLKYWRERKREEKCRLTGLALGIKKYKHRNCNKTVKQKAAV